MPAVFINPKTDFAFKKIFGSKHSKDILISFLDAILYNAAGMILDVEILDPHQAPRIKGIKDSYLHVKATIQDGQSSKTVTIEMQVLSVLGFEKRVLYNAAKSFSMSIQLGVGEDYTFLNLVIALTITDFFMFEDTPRIISRYRLKETDDLTDYSEGIELVFVELPKFTKTLDELDSLMEKWLYFLKSANQLETVPPKLGSVPALNHAFEVAQQSHLSKKELDLLKKRQMFLHDNRNAILYAEQKGLQKGLEQGRQEGAYQERIAIAQQLLDLLDIETISQKTGLPIADIQALKRETSLRQREQ